MREYAKIYEEISSQGYEGKDTAYIKTVVDNGLNTISAFLLLETFVNAVYIGDDNKIHVYGGVNTPRDDV